MWEVLGSRGLRSRRIEPVFMASVELIRQVGGEGLRVILPALHSSRCLSRRITGWRELNYGRGVDTPLLQWPRYLKSFPVCFKDLKVRGYGDRGNRRWA